jgi:hypothetical protein
MPLMPMAVNHIMDNISVPLITSLGSETFNFSDKIFM